MPCRRKRAGLRPSWAETPNFNTKSKISFIRSLLHLNEMSLSKLLSRLRLAGKNGNSVHSRASTPYIYPPLNESSHGIRLLTLHRGKPEDPIKITVTNTPFIIERVPFFEALSYTWGSPENPIDIFVAHLGGEFGGVLSVTKNLGEALPYLRLKERDRVLWIDAICT